MAKSACTKKMINPDRVMEAISEMFQQYNDGLIMRGEFVRGSMAKLEELVENDLHDARRTILSYGYDQESFFKYMEKKAIAELKEQ